MQGWVPFVGVVVAIFLWGSFTVPLKSKAVVECELHPLWFQLYCGLGVSLSSLVFIAVEPGCISDFTGWGVVSAFMWVLANSAAMAAVQILGIATAQSSWGAMIAIISFVWGIAWGDKPNNLPLSIAGVVLLICGICTLAYVGSKAAADNDEAKLLDDEPLLDEDSKDPASMGKKEKPSTMIGFMCVSVTGVFAGSIFVPLKLAPSRYRDGLQAIKFAFAQGISTFVACIFWIPILFLMLYLKDKFSGNLRGRTMREWLPPHHCRKCLLAGASSGAIWNMGNLGATLGSLPPLQTVGYTLSQAALLVGALWGVLFFREIKGSSNLMLFAVGAGFTCAGLGVSGFFGQSS
jgi:glucose uptake protein GlcU